MFFVLGCGLLVACAGSDSSAEMRLARVRIVGLAIADGIFSDQ